MFDIKYLREWADKSPGCFSMDIVQKLVLEALAYIKCLEDQVTDLECIIDNMRAYSSYDD